MIQHSYSTDYPQIQRIQGGILYPHGVEQVKTEDGDQYRFRYIKFPDDGQDIRDPKKFAELHADMIAEYLKQDVDFQALTLKHRDWVYRVGFGRRAYVKSAFASVFFVKRI
jgi:hypothetical protein